MITQDEWDRACESMTPEQRKETERRSMPRLPAALPPNVRGERVLDGEFARYGLSLFGLAGSDHEGFPKASFFVGSPFIHSLFTEHDRAIALAYCGTKEAALENALEVIRMFTPEEMAELMREGMELRHQELEERRRWLHERCEREMAEMPPRAPRLKKPKEVTRRRTRIFNKSGGKCHYCLTPLQLDGHWHVEHLTPVSLDGGNDDSNLAAACVSCNQAKKDKTEAEFMAVIRQEAA